jgi:hypothetical protein
MTCRSEEELDMRDSPKAQCRLDNAETLRTSDRARHQSQELARQSSIRHQIPEMTIRASLADGNRSGAAAEDVVYQIHDVINVNVA